MIKIAWLMHAVSDEMTRYLPTAAVEGKVGAAKRVKAPKKFITDRFKAALVCWLSLLIVVSVSVLFQLCALCANNIYFG